MKYLLPFIFISMAASATFAENLRVIEPFGPVEVYDEPSYEGTELAIIDVGGVVELVSDIDIYDADVYYNQDYVQVKTADGVTGYVFIPALQKIDDPDVLIYSVREGANGKILTAPNFGSKSQLLEVISPHTSVEVLSEHRGFREVKLSSGVTGWMARNNLEPSKETMLANNNEQIQVTAESDRVSELIVLIDGLNEAYRLQLDWKNAPKSAARIVRLAQENRYDNTIIHRYSRGLSIALGDVQYGKRDALDLANLGKGKSEYDNLERELSAVPMTAGSVIMLSGKEGTNSQFGLLLADAPYLAGNFTRVGFLEGELTKIINLAPSIRANNTFVERVMTPTEYEGYKALKLIKNTFNKALAEKAAKLRSVWGAEILMVDRSTFVTRYGKNRSTLETVKNAEGQDHCQITIGHQLDVVLKLDDKWVKRVYSEWRIDLLKYINFVLAEEDRYAFSGSIDDTVVFSHETGIEVTKCETTFAQDFSGPISQCPARPFLQVGADKRKAVQDSLFSLMSACRTIFGK